MAKISLEQALSLVNAGGWQLRSGHSAKGVKPNMLVTDAEIIGDALVLQDGYQVASIKVERLLVEMIDEGRPRHLVFNGPYMAKQQRKVVDGGGFHEVEQIGTQFLLVNTAAQAQYEVELANEREQAKAATRVQEIAAKAQAEEKRRRVLEERDSRVLMFLTRQKERIAGRRVVDLTGGSMGLTIKFDDGYELNIELDGGDTFDAWINVDGGGEKISLESGQLP